MDCASALERLSERIDGVVTPEGAVALESHLAECEHCRAAADQMNRLDALCRRALPQSDAAGRVAAVVMERLRSPSVRPSRRNWTALVLAAATLAASVVVVLSILPRSKQAAVVDQVPGSTADLPPLAEPEFDVTLARGTVEVRKVSTDDWIPLALPSNSRQPEGCYLRTMEDGQCEVVCPTGGLVRLDTGTEVQLASANALNVYRGKVWCRAPATQSLRVFTCPPDNAQSLAAAMQCEPAGTMQADLDEDESQMTVVAAADGVEVISGDRELRLKKGERLRLSAEELGVQRAYDLAVETSWMMPLLALRGGEDAEFSTRVSSMLADVGRSKIGYMHEQTLIDLGGPAALPLIAFLRSPESDQEPDRRLAAARIIRLTAPEESIPDLVELLGDREPEVRVASAEALQRLTAMDFGVEPEEWRTLGPEQRMALDQWRMWVSTRESTKA